MAKTVEVDGTKLLTCFLVDSFTHNKHQYAASVGCGCNTTFTLKPENFEVSLFKIKFLKFSKIFLDTANLEKIFSQGICVHRFH